MSYSATISGKTVKIDLTQAARRALAEAAAPIQAQMELYFSCLIRKRVLFLDTAKAADGVPVSDKLYVQFRPVMTSHCGTDYIGDEPPLTDFPIEDATPFIPRWLKIDYRRGQWRGEFGY